MTKVYILHFTSPLDEALYNKLYNNCTIARQTKTDRYRNIKDQERSILSENIILYALKQEGIHNIEFEYGPHGKPLLKDNSIHFNSSHSGDYVVCATSALPVGIDVETIEEARLNLAKRFFHIDEYNYLKETSQNTDELFYKYWTLKESYIKSTGDGLSDPLNNTNFDLSNPDTITMHYKGILDTSHTFRTITLKKHMLSVCSLEDNISITYIEIDSLII